MPRRPGKPLPKARKADAEVTPADVAAAREAWKRDAPRGYRKLLDAKGQAPK